MVLAVSGVLNGESGDFSVDSLMSGLLLGGGDMTMVSMPGFAWGVSSRSSRKDKLLESNCPGIRRYAHH